MNSGPGSRSIAGSIAASSTWPSRTRISRRSACRSVRRRMQPMRCAIHSTLPSGRTPPRTTGRCGALAAMAIASAREIQVLEAPHIAAADDGVMTPLEQRMASAEASARDALRTLGGLSRTCLATATGVGHCRLRSAGWRERRDHPPLASQQQRPVARAVTESEADHHCRLRGHSSRAPGRTRETRIHRHALGSDVGGRVVRARAARPSSRPRCRR